MAKIVPPKNIGIPVPTPPPANTDHLIMYYGATPMTATYSQNTRADLSVISSLNTVTASNSSYWSVNVASYLPSNLPDGNYDFSFTLMDTNGNEGDFSPNVTEAIDFTVPPTLGQPIILG